MLHLIYIYNGYNVLCSLYAGGVLWDRNVRNNALLALWAL